MNASHRDGHQGLAEKPAMQLSGGGRKRVSLDFEPILDAAEGAAEIREERS